LTTTERMTLKELRLFHQYSQAELADILKVKQSTIWRWEKDKVKVSFRGRRAICRLYEIDKEEVAWPGEE
jgi:DNA-binding XRE family transcriptional regulator